jgi:hypothetical protein
LTEEELAENLHLLNIDQILPLPTRKRLQKAPQKPDKPTTEESDDEEEESESDDTDDDSSESESSSSSSSDTESDSDSDKSDEETDTHNTIKQTEDKRDSPTNEEDDDIIILSDDDDDRILDDNLDIAPPSETTYHVTCYMTRNTTPTRTLAHYDVFTSFTIPANTNSFLDNAHYQHIKTEARRKMLTKEPLKSLILDGVSIQLHVPQVYYEVKGGDKQQVPLPLSPESMAHIPEPRYHKRDDGATFVLLSVYFVMTLDYFHVVHKMVTKRIQHIQQHPDQSHPIDRVLSLFKATKNKQHSQTTQTGEDISNNNSNPANTPNNNDKPQPAQPQSSHSDLKERRRLERPRNSTNPKRRRIEFPTSTTTNTRTTLTVSYPTKASVFDRLGRRTRSPDDFNKIEHEEGKRHKRH